MLQIKDIEKLAELARIEIPAEEKDTLRREVDSILSYVGEIQKLSGDDLEKAAGSTRNVMRKDEKAHLSGEFTEDLLDEAPVKDGEYIRVKKIL